MPVPLLNPTDYPATDYFSAYGGKPTLPTPVGSATGAVTGNIGNFGGIYNLGLNAATAGAASAEKPYLRNLPNYADMITQRSGNVTQQLRGQLPDDVIRQIAQQSAERGIATGTSGGPNANAAYLRALGLNSLQMQQQGSAELSRSIAARYLSNPHSTVGSK